MALDPSVDIDAGSGANILGWRHVLQCIEDFFTTSFGERVMREWYGSLVPRLLGENMNAETIVTFFAAMASAIEQWEPRYRITQIVPISVERLGRFTVEIQGEYRPRALLGDFTAEGAKRISLFNDGQDVRVTDAN